METTKPKPFCFVLMPFEESFSDVYELGIKSACKEAGAYSERVDEQIFQERIIDRIYNQIAKADIVIADMSGKNPNVFYEVGYAHAIGKTTILLTQKSEDIPFDLKHFPHIIYNNKILELKEELVKRVKWFLENPGIKAEEKLAIEVFINGIDISFSEEEIKGRLMPNKSGRVDFRIIFFNNSILTFSEGDFKIGLITETKSSTLYFMNKQIRGIVLPDKRKLFMLPNLDTLFPSAYTATDLFFYFEQPSLEIILIRLFSSAGTRDYYLKVNFT